MTAVITGGVCGIGRELAKDLTGRGDGVMIDDLALWLHGCCSSQIRRPRRSRATRR